MVKSIKNILDLVNGVSENLFTKSSFFKNACQVYYTVSLHTKGARPYFKDLKSGSNAMIYPPSYFGKEYQNLFDNFLFTRHPRENDLTRSWRYSQYRPRTKRAFLKIIELISGICYQDGQYFFSCENKEDEEYVFNSIFDIRGFNFFKYFKHVMLPTIMEDANGFMVVIPEKPSIAIKEKKIPVSLKYVKITDVLDFNQNELIYKDGNFIFHVTKNKIDRYKKINDKYAFDLVYFQHDFNFLPVNILGGIWNTEGFFNSYFEKAIPIADEYISSYSAEQMIDKEASHPYIQISKIDCPACQKTGTIQVNCDITVENPLGVALESCKTCKGGGEISWNPMDRFEVPQDGMDKNYVKIITPDSNFNIYHNEKNIELMNELLGALDLLYVDQAQSGAAKTLDKENLKIFCTTICERLFTLKAFAIKCIIGYRNVKTENGKLVPHFLPFTLVAPSNLDLRDETDLIKEVDETFALNMPPFLRKEALLNFVDKRYAGNDILLKKTRLILATDFLCGLNEEEIKSLNISAEDTDYHIKADILIDDLITEITEKKFIETNLQTLITKINEKRRQENN